MLQITFYKKTINNSHNQFLQIFIKYFSNKKAKFFIYLYILVYQKIVLDVLFTRGNMDNKFVVLDKTVKIGKNVKIYPFNVILGDSEIGDNSTIYPYNFINNCKIASDCEISSSNLENSIVEKGCKIGPFARLRPNSKIGESCKIGNFVEVKNSQLSNGVKASHLSYIGDASVGKHTNIGCGAIFVNYNGKEKNKTIVGDNCFVGSNVNLIAPLTVADYSYICAGSTLTKDTQNDDFVIARARETIKHNRASTYLKKQ